MKTAILARVAIGFALCGLAADARAQTLETETARLLPSRQTELGFALEVQRSSEGTERALPFLFVYGITNKLEVMIEPVPSTLIRPKTGRSAKGAGDVEVTFTYRVHEEGRRLPAFALAGEIKLPTARNSFIGTGKTDYAVFLTESKRFGRLDTHAHVSYTFVGQPAGTRLGNIVGIGVAAVYSASREFDVFGEVLSDTASTPGGEGSGLAVPSVPEAAGGELVTTVGIAWHRSRLTLYVSGSHDNIGAVLIRSGFVIRFR